MKKLNCRLIVSDFDGTLADSRNEVPEEVKNAINGYVADGGIFAVCTGRILPSILPRIKEIGLKGLVVACQGAVIYDTESGKILRNKTFTNAQTSRICRALEEMNAPVQAYHSGGYISSLPRGEKHLALYESIVGVEAEHTDRPLSQTVAEDNRGFNKVATLCRPEEQAAIYSALKEKFGEEFDVTCSAKVLVEISPAGETKGAALGFLARHYGVPLERCCAVGDNLNDLSMVERAGYGVAVGNAAEGLKARAKFVTVTCDEGAVARVIERFGYIEND